MRADGWTPAAIRLRDDDLLGSVVAACGPMHIAPADDFFARFVQSVVRQQLSMAAADAIHQRLRSRCDMTPAAIRRTDIAVLREAGLSRRKAETMRALAGAFEDGGWCRDTFADRSNEEVIETLTAVDGIGVWTAKMQLIFSLGREDVFPVEDLGVRRGMCALTGEELSRAEMLKIAERWRPHRSLASVYLWAAQEG